jgi:hypothetical protein
MAEHIDWLKEEIAKTERMIRRFQQRLDHLNSVLSFALKKQKTDIQVVPEQEQKESKSKTMIDMIEDILIEQGPCKAAKIKGALRELGRETSTNSINVSLNRLRPKRFDRDEMGNWVAALTAAASSKKT